MDDDLDPLIARCRMQRMAKGLTQRDVARIARTHQNYISNIETGLQIPGLGLFQRYAKACGMQVVLIHAASPSTMSTENGDDFYRYN